MLLTSLSAVGEGGRRELIARLATEHSFVSLCDLFDLNLCARLPAFTVRLITRGSVVFAATGGSVRLGPGHYLIANPDDTLRPAQASDDVRVLLVGLTVTQMDQAFVALRASARHILHDASSGDGDGAHFPLRAQRSDDAVMPILKELHQVTGLGVNDSAWLSRQYDALAERLLFMDYRRRLRATTRRSTHDLDVRLDQTREYMRKHYARALDLNALSERCAVSVHHFLRQFKSRFGQTPHRYLVEIRLRAAHRLLLETALNVGEIGRAVGFASDNGFHRAFRRHFGCAPSDVRSTTQLGCSGKVSVRPTDRHMSLWSVD